MDGDVDMDAPQISTLREEETPPPQRSKFRVKLVVKDPRPSTSTMRKQFAGAPSEDDDEEEEDEEDQLIDDDDDDMNPTPPVSGPSLAPAPPPPRAAPEPPKRKTPRGRRPRKTDKRVIDEEKKIRERAMQAGAPSLAPTMSWFEVEPSESYSKGDSRAGSVDSSQMAAHEPFLPKVALKKKVPPRKPGLAPRVRTKAAPKSDFCFHVLAL